MVDDHVAGSQVSCGSRWICALPRPIHDRRRPHTEPPGIFLSVLNTGAVALEEAAVLAESLADADRIPAALAAYERRRRPRTDWVLSHTHRGDRTRTRTRTLVPIVRNLAVKHLGQRIYRATIGRCSSSPDNH